MGMVHMGDRDEGGEGGGGDLTPSLDVVASSIR